MITSVLVSGEGADPNCFHCELQKAMDKFIEDHPGTSGHRLMCDMLQFLGECFASCYEGRELRMRVAAACDALLRNALDCEQAYKESGASNPS